MRRLDSVGIKLFHVFSKFGSEKAEEKIVEFHNPAATSPIGVGSRSGAAYLACGCKLLRDFFCNQAWIGIPKPIYALLCVADDEIVVAFPFTFGEEWLEICPLHAARVLKLIDKEMIEPTSETLIHERGIIIADDTLEYGVGLSKFHRIAIGEKQPGVASYALQKTDIGHRGLIYAPFSHFLAPDFGKPSLIERKHVDGQTLQAVFSVGAKERIVGLSRVENA